MLKAIGDAIAVVSGIDIGAVRTVHGRIHIACNPNRKWPPDRAVCVSRGRWAGAWPLLADRLPLAALACLTSSGIASLIIAWYFGLVDEGSRKKN